MTLMIDVSDITGIVFLYLKVSTRMEQHKKIQETNLC